MSDFFSPLSRKRTKRDYDPMEKILPDWYGKTLGNNEISSRLPETVKLETAMEEALEKLLPYELATLQKIKSEWEQIAGKQLATFMTPSALYKKTLTIEVSHPAWLMEFKDTDKTMLLEKIAAKLGQNKCTEIKLVPTGKNRRK